jgi:hypothetical protein
VRPNNSFKPTPHRGVNSVLYATLHAVATPPRGGLTQALYAVKQRLAWVRCSCDFISNHAVPQSSTAHIGECSAHTARLSARQRSVQLFAPERVHLMMLFAPVGLRSGSAALLASVTVMAANCSRSRLCLPAPDCLLQQIPGTLSLRWAEHGRITIRSSRPHVVASATYLRYASTRPPPRHGAA